MTAAYTAAELDAAYAAVMARHPDMPDDELRRKALRVAALTRYASDPAVWGVGQ